MNQTFSWIMSTATNHDVLVYGLIAILACAEGPIVSLILGVLLRFDYLYFLPSYGALIVGDMIGDTAWYFIGRAYGHRFISRFGRAFNITEERIEQMTRVFYKYKKRVLFISKVSNGFGLSLITLMTAGMIRIPFMSYLGVNFLGQFIWTGTLLAVGYFFSNAFISINNWVGRASLAVGLVAALFIGYRYWKSLKYRAEHLDV